MAFETGLLCGPEGRGIMRVVVDIVMTRGTGVLQFLDVEPMGNGNIVGVDFRRGSLHIKDALMAADAVGVNLVKLGRKTGMFSSAFEGKDVDARHQGMACRVAFRAVDLGMEVRLLPERRLSLLVVAGNTELLLGRRIGGQGDGGIEAQNR